MLRLLRSLRARLQPQRDDKSGDTYTHLVAKKSARWPFDALLRSLTQRGAPQSAEGLYSKIDLIRERLVNDLTGQRKRTSFRHEEVEMDAGECVSGVSSPETAARLIYSLVRLFKPSRIVEIGSAFGVSTMYIAEAVRMNGAGEVVGIEYEGWRADIANACLAQHWQGIARVETGPAEEVFPRLRDQYGVFDFAFVDAVHKFDNTVGYHQMLCTTSTASTIAVYDDMNWSADMERVWDYLCRQDQISDALLVNGRWGLVRYGASD